MSQLCCIAVFLALSCHIGLVYSAPDCRQQHKSDCPQSSFQTQQGSRWKCPTGGWSSSASFSSTRIAGDLKPIDTSNLTAQVDEDPALNKTSITFCSTDAKPKATDQWPAGGYCVPVPSDKACPVSMVSTNITVTAPGRVFDCKSGPPMKDCGNGTFTITACCPTSMEADDDYLNVPLYDIEYFYLLKTNKTCPKAYSFKFTEESVQISNANASDYFPSSADGTLTITFCRYSNVTCKKREPETPYELLVMGGECNRKLSIYCNAPYTVQPPNTGFAVMEFCYPNGKFASINQFCGAECPTLPAVANAKVVQNETVATVTCHDGFYLTGNSSTTCQRNGEWTHNISTTTCTFAECKEKDLKVRGVPKRINWTSDGSEHPFFYGHNVTYTIQTPGPPLCYRFADADRNINIDITCQKDGTWTSLPGLNSGKVCPIPANTTTATHTVPSGTKLRCESVVQYTCIDHHISQKDNLTLTCQADGTFDHDPPNCGAVFCDQPNLNVTDGEVMYTSPAGVPGDEIPPVLLEGSILIYECDPSYRVVGDELIVCGGDGSWNGTTDSNCQLIVCPKPPITIPGGHRVDDLINQTIFHLGDEARYECDNYTYDLNYTDAISCSNDGNWNPYIPACNEVRCDAPTPIDHGVRPSGTYKLYSNFTYTCNPGYLLESGAEPLFCNFSDDGILGWQGDLPSCVELFCPTPPPLPHGNITTPNFNSSLSRYPYNTSFNYSCNEGYNTSVAYYTACARDASWTPSPVCNAVQCRKPGIAYSVINSSRSLFNYKDILNIRCDDSRLYHKPQNLMCMGDYNEKTPEGWVVLSGDKLITCHGLPDPSPSIGSKKWTFVGVGVSMFVVVCVILLFYIVRKRRNDAILRSPFGDGKSICSMNPAYNAEGRELTGFSNPTYEDHETSNRLVLKDSQDYVITPKHGNRMSTMTVDSEATDWASSPEEQYDTLHKQSNKNKHQSIPEPEEGQYNTLSQAKAKMNMRNLVDPEDVFADDDDIYNVPTKSPEPRPSTLPMNHYEIDSTRRETDESEDIYNVPTLNRNTSPSIRVSDGEVNDLYSNPAAAEICGTPIETDFDNIIYDNI